MDLPETVTEYDKDVFLSTLIRRYATLPIMYNDPDWFYSECEFWFKQHKFAFTKMWEAMETEYKPLENYNRHHDETSTPGVTKIETHSGSDTETHGGIDSTSITGTEANAKTGHDDIERFGTTTNSINTVQNSTETVENKVSAFNENNYQPSSQSTSNKVYANGLPDNTTSELTHDNDKDVQTYGSTDTLTHNTTNALTHGETITDQHGHVVTNTQVGFDKLVVDDTGNIGVTTSQQMLESEILLRHKIDMYKVMAIDFASEMLVRVF